MKIYSSIVDDRLVDVLGDFAYFENEEDAKEFCRLQGDTDCSYLEIIDVIDHKEAERIFNAMPQLEPMESKPLIDDNEYQKLLKNSLNG